MATAYPTCSVSLALARSVRQRACARSFGSACGRSACVPAPASHLLSSLAGHHAPPGHSRASWSAPLSSLSHGLPPYVKIVEVGPRDGLQNEPMPVSTHVKVQLINRLAREAHLPVVECTSFVSPSAVPQMADAPLVLSSIDRATGTVYSALTPNLKGLHAALQAGVSEVAVFGAASDAFSQRNIRCSVIESLQRFKPVCDAARDAGVRVRGYVSCVVGCPYQGYVAPDAVGFVALSLAEMGCYEVSLGDTIGVGTPRTVSDMIRAVTAHGLPRDMLAVHFHNTYGSALANVLAALEMGVSVVDASVAGLGGCPYAKGASGNVPTEDVVYMLHGMGVRTGVDLDALVSISDWICTQLQRPNQSKVAVARLSSRSAHDAVQAAIASAPVGDAAALVKARKEEKTCAVALAWPQTPEQVAPPPTQLTPDAAGEGQPLPAKGAQTKGDAAAAAAPASASIPHMVTTAATASATSPRPTATVSAHA